MKQQRIERTNPQKAPQIIDTRQPKAAPLPEETSERPDLPLRTVFFMEVGEMPPHQVQYLVQEANKVYIGAKGGVHYVLPVRDGKIGPDMVFEEEWLSVVKQTCEVNPQGEIVLKGGCTECLVVRQSI